MINILFVTVVLTVIVVAALSIKVFFGKKQVGESELASNSNGGCGCGGSCGGGGGTKD